MILTQQPPSIASSSTTPKAPPVPVSDCWKWCIESDSADAVITAGAKATLTVIFPLTCTVPANGTALKLWGYDFTVQSATDFTSESFKVVSSGITTAGNFANMLLSNIFFSRALQGQSLTIGANVTMVFTWSECREQPRFADADFVFTAITATGGSASKANGSTAVYAEGYTVITRLIRYLDATGTSYPVTEYDGLLPDKLCDSVGDICVDYSSAAAGELYTILPDLTIDSRVSAVDNGRSMMRLFALQYGFVYRENCVAKSGTIKTSPLVLGINAAFDQGDIYQFRRYWYDHPDGLPPGQTFVDYLTTQPKGYALCENSFAWLWMTNNWQADFGANYRLWARFVLYKTGVSGVFETFDFLILNPGTDGNVWYRPVCFNVSPGFVVDNAPTLTMDNLDYYEVQVIGKDAGGSVLFNATEYVSYKVLRTCDCHDVYFLTPAGGFGTIPVIVTERQAEQSAQTITLPIDCDSDISARGVNGGQTQIGHIGNEIITFRAVGSKTSKEWKDWFKHFRFSPQRFFKDYDNAGNPIKRKLLLDDSSVKIETKGEQIIFTATGRLQRVPVQTPKFL